MSSDYPYHLSRLYVSASLAAGQNVMLSDGQAHYLRHVMRLEEGAKLRVFNERDGEWLAALSFPTKKAAGILCETLLRTPGSALRRVHLYFSPIKKERLAYLVEKSVELGVTDLHPLVMRRSVMRDIKVERTEAQIIEAAEQCERMDIPVLHAPVSLEKFVQQFDGAYPVYAAVERQDALPLLPLENQGDVCGFLVGPEGGFDAEEVALLLSKAFIRPVSLGPRILRAETAAIYGLARLAH